MNTFGFIGCGNMGGALASAVAGSGIAGENLILSDVSAERATLLAGDIKATVGDNKKIAEKCNYIFLGVKPNMVAEVLKDIKPILGKRTDAVLVSMAAGLSIEKIQSVAGNIPIIRIMPNTPVRVGKGVILYAGSGVTDSQLKGFLDGLSTAGTIIALEERLIDAASAVSGCGPAFCYMFLEALADGGVKCGLSRADATLLAAATLRGAAEMVIRTGEHPEKLKDDVCSPAGSTIAGVQALENGGLRSNVINCVEASFRRTKELG